MLNANVLGPLQTALYAALTGALAVEVYDHVPEASASRTPYVTLGEATSSPAGAHDRFGARSTVTLHVWSTYHGYSEVNGIVDTILATLDEQTLVVADHATVAVRHLQTVLVQDPDPEVRHAVVRLTVETEKSA